VHRGMGRRGVRRSDTGRLRLLDWLSDLLRDLLSDLLRDLLSDLLRDLLRDWLCETLRDRLRDWWIGHRGLWGSHVRMGGG